MLDQTQVLALTDFTGYHLTVMFSTFSTEPLPHPPSYVQYIFSWAPPPPPLSLSHTYTHTNTDQLAYMSLECQYTVIGTTATLPLPLQMKKYLNMFSLCKQINVIFPNMSLHLVWKQKENQNMMSFGFMLISQFEQPLPHVSRVLYKSPGLKYCKIFCKTKNSFLLVIYLRQSYLLYLYIYITYILD